MESREARQKGLVCLDVDDRVDNKALNQEQGKKVDEKLSLFRQVLKCFQTVQKEC